MKRFLYYWLLVFGVALLFAGCTNEEDARGKASNELMVNLNVATPVSFGNSRALTTENENKISNIHILAFDWDTGEMISNGYTEVDNKSNMTCRLSLAGDQNTKVALYAIANIGNSSVFDDHTLTRSDFEGLYVQASNVDDISAGTYTLYKADGSEFASVSNATHALLVSSKLDTYHTTLNYSGINVTLNLERLSPKIILNLYGNDINLVSYQFCNIPTKDNILGGEQDMTGISCMNSSENNFAANTTSAEDIAFYGFKSYKTPNTNVTGQRDRTDENAPEKAAYLDIKGYPVSNPDKLYRYRVYLGGVNAAGVATPSEFSLLRNHDYHLNIILSSYIIDDNRTGVYSDLNTTIEVTPWATETRNAMDMDVVSVEQHAIGDFLCSDGSVITPEEVSTSNKTPIAIIFSTETSATDRAHGWNYYAMALKNVHSSGSTVGDYEWANSESDIIGILNTSNSTWQTSSSDMEGYTNTTYLNSTAYPAGYAAKTTYASQVTAPSNTSGWFLPSSGQWYNILVNLGGMAAEPDFSHMWNGDSPSNFTSSICATALNNKISVVGAGNYDAFFSNTSSSENYWSSSEYSSRYAYGAAFSSFGSMVFASYLNKSYTRRVRAVIAF